MPGVLPDRKVAAYVCVTDDRRTTFCNRQVYRKRRSKARFGGNYFDESPRIVRTWASMIISRYSRSRSWFPSTVAGSNAPGDRQDDGSEPDESETGFARFFSAKTNRHVSGFPSSGRKQAGRRFGCSKTELVGGLVGGIEKAPQMIAEELFW